MQQDDLAYGDWYVDSKELNVWVDASSVAIGVALEWRETVLEDTCWLRPEADGQHINFSRTRCRIERHQFGSPVRHVKTDSVCMYHWISDTLTEKSACLHLISKRDAH